MSATTDFDGLCGIIHDCATSDKQVRCKYKFAHEGKCSWAANDDKGGCCISFRGFFTHPVEEYTQVEKIHFLDQLEYDRGKFDAEHNFPPAIMVGKYAEGYSSVIKPDYYKR